MHPNGWTEREDQILKEYWGKKICQEIGDKIGRTKNSIIGRAKRIGLEKLKSVDTRPRKDRNPQNGYTKGTLKRGECRRVRRKPTILETPLPGYGKKIGIFSMTGHTCRWVMDDRGEDGLATMCGHYAEAGHSYCSKHEEVVFLPYDPRTRRWTRSKTF